MSLLWVLRPLRGGMLAGLALRLSVREPLVLSRGDFLYFATHTKPQLAPHSPVTSLCCFCFGDVRATASADARLASSEPQKRSIATKVNVRSATCVLVAALPPGSGLCPPTETTDQGSPTPPRSQNASPSLLQLLLATALCLVCISQPRPARPSLLPTGRPIPCIAHW